MSGPVGAGLRADVPSGPVLRAVIAAWAGMCPGGEACCACRIAAGACPSGAGGDATDVAAGPVEGEGHPGLGRPSGSGRVAAARVAGDGLDA
jgi:hypothetical protein